MLAAEAVLRNPMVGIADCCARARRERPCCRRAATGHAAAPPSSVAKNFRRWM
jgi:hypothetical protein